MDTLNEIEKLSERVKQLEAWHSWLRGGWAVLLLAYLQTERRQPPMINFLLQHQFWDAVVLYWIFSAAISALPEPKPDGSAGYLWLYRFLHTTAGNISTAISLTAARYRACASRRLPGMKPFILLLLVPLVLSTTACAMHKEYGVSDPLPPASRAAVPLCEGDNNSPARSATFYRLDKHVGCGCICCPK